MAGVAVGPFTPGLDADSGDRHQLAEIGVILLMFGVGIHFSLRDLLAVRSIAMPGAIGQIVVATRSATARRGSGAGRRRGLVLGLAISVASTVVLMRALMDRNDLNTAQGRIAVGWLMVRGPAHGGGARPAAELAPLLGGTADERRRRTRASLESLALGKVVLFAVLMFVAGARVVPWLLVQVARTGSRELFMLTVLAVALGIAFVPPILFGVSLGARRVPRRWSSASPT